MTLNELLRATVARVIVEHLGVAPSLVTDAATLNEDLAADSLDCFEIMLALEEQLDLEIPDQDAAPLKTVGELLAYLECRLRAKAVTV